MFKIKTSIGEMYFPDSAILKGFTLNVNDVTSELDKQQHVCLIKDVEITIRFKELYITKERIESLVKGNDKAVGFGAEDVFFP